jgi:hypothetical protein
MASMAMQKLKDQVLGLPEQERAELVDDNCQPRWAGDGVEGRFK